MKLLNIAVAATVVAALGAVPAHAAATGLDALLGSRETMAFIAINLFLTVYFAFLKFDRFAVAYGPEVLTTVGIFGCFVGIALALLNFDSGNLTSSVPALLDGVKTAFWASVSGVGGALVIRWRHYTHKAPIPQSGDTAKAASLEDVVTSLSALRSGLVGQEEGTLLTQMKLARQESNDQLGKLITSFDGFARHMVENNQKAIIEALREVIADFNAKLTEQFGENFKHLNSAVEKLVVWQQQYRLELDELQTVQQQSAADMRSAADAFSTIVDRSERFASVAEHLAELLRALDAQRDILFEQERTLNTVLATMKDVTPQFATQVEAMLRDLQSGVAQVQGQTAEIVKNFGVQAQSSSAEMKNLLTQTIQSAQRELQAGLNDNQKIIKEGVIALDKALQKELSDSLDALGRQLASLSAQFVNDYGPLTEKLRDLVRLSSRVDA
ncbi:MAG: hypothetical protein Q7J32_12545 [Sphingomonadaceae bacterium]|nr:hypothetical protein [Sphingomonadaceae bacterium]